MSRTIEVAPRTVVTVYMVDEALDRPWTILGDLRAPGTGWADDSNYLVYDVLKPAHPLVQFDSESSCFYAYAPTEDEALSLVESIKEWMVARGRDVDTPVSPPSFLDAVSEAIRQSRWKGADTSTDHAAAVLNMEEMQKIRAVLDILSRTTSVRGLVLGNLPPNVIEWLEESEEEDVE